MKTNTVSLTIPEFLSLYTGCLFAPSISTVSDACEKVFGFAPYTLTMASCAEQFQQAINENRPDLVALVQSCGEIKEGHTDEFMQAFAQRLNSDTVEVSTQKYHEADLQL